MAAAAALAIFSKLAKSAKSEQASSLPIIEDGVIFSSKPSSVLTGSTRLSDPLEDGLLGISLELQLVSNVNPAR